MLTEVLDWHTLGIKLGIPDHSLWEIQIDYSAYGTGRQKQQMITKWLEYDTEASWDKLTNALKEMGKHVAPARIGNTHVPGYRGKTAPVSVNNKMSIVVLPVGLLQPPQHKVYYQSTLYSMLNKSIAIKRMHSNEHYERQGRIIYLPVHVLHVDIVYICVYNFES